MQGQPRKYTKNCKVFHIFAEVIKFKIHKIHKVGHKQDVLSTAAQIAVKHCPKDTKEEAKEIRVKFWEGFKRYCKRKHIYRKWVLTGVKIRSTQLKFYADREKALVLFQIDHKNELRRFEVYECMLSYQTLFRAECGDELKWEEEYTGIEGQEISAIYFELRGVNLYRVEDHERIYTFFAEKMPLLEDLYYEYRDLINERLKQNDN